MQIFNHQPIKTQGITKWADGCDHNFSCKIYKSWSTGSVAENKEHFANFRKRNRKEQQSLNFRTECAFEMWRYSDLITKNMRKKQKTHRNNEHFPMKRDLKKAKTHLHSFPNIWKLSCSHPPKAWWVTGISNEPIHIWMFIIFMKH